MRYKGKKISNDCIEIVVIPRKDEDLVFKFKPVLDWDRFNKLCPEPVPPSILRAGSKITELDFTDKEYLNKRQKQVSLKGAYIFLESIKASDDLEWDTVDYEDPASWLNYHQELLDSQFTSNEVNKLSEAVMKVNALSDEHLDEAKERFLASMAVVAE